MAAQYGTNKKSGYTATAFLSFSGRVKFTIKAVAGSGWVGGDDFNGGTGLDESTIDTSFTSGLPAFLLREGESQTFVFETGSTVYLAAGQSPGNFVFSYSAVSM